MSAGTVDELRRRAEVHERFELEVRNVDPGRLKRMAAGCAAIDPIDVVQRNGVIELSVEFARGSDGFPRLMRVIIEDGGDVYGSAP